MLGTGIPIKILGLVHERGHKENNASSAQYVNVTNGVLDQNRLGAVQPPKVLKSSTQRNIGGIHLPTDDKISNLLQHIENHEHHYSYCFQQRRGTLDVKHLERVNLIDIVGNKDLKAMHSSIRNITFACIGLKDLNVIDDNLQLKLYHLLQYTIEHLLNVNVKTTEEIANLQQENTKLKQRNKKRNECNKTLSKENKIIKRGMRLQRNALLAYESLLLGASQDRSLTRAYGIVSSWKEKFEVFNASHKSSILKATNERDKSYEASANVNPNALNSHPASSLSQNESIEPVMEKVIKEALEKQSRDKRKQDVQHELDIVNLQLKMAEQELNGRYLNKNKKNISNDGILKKMQILESRCKDLFARYQIKSEKESKSDRQPLPKESSKQSKVPAIIDSKESGQFRTITPLEEGAKSKSSNIDFDTLSAAQLDRNKKNRLKSYLKRFVTKHLRAAIMKWKLHLTFLRYTDILQQKKSIELKSLDQVKEIESLRNREILHKNKLTSYAPADTTMGVYTEEEIQRIIRRYLKALKQNQITDTISEIMSDIDVNTMQKLKDPSQIGFQTEVSSRAQHRLLLPKFSPIPKHSFISARFSHSIKKIREQIHFINSLLIKKAKGEYDIDLTEEPNVERLSEKHRNKLLKHNEIHVKYLMEGVMVRMKELDTVLNEHATNYFAEDSLYKVYLEDREKQTLSSQNFLEKSVENKSLQAAMKYFQSHDRGKTDLGNSSQGILEAAMQYFQGHDRGKADSPPLPPKSHSPPSPPLPSRSHRVTPPLPRRELSYSSDTDTDVTPTDVKHENFDPPIQNVTSISIPTRVQRSISAGRKMLSQRTPSPKSTIIGNRSNMHFSKSGQNYGEEESSDLVSPDDKAVAINSSVGPNAHADNHSSNSISVDSIKSPLALSAKKLWEIDDDESANDKGIQNVSNADNEQKEEVSNPVDINDSADKNKERNESVILDSFNDASFASSFDKSPGITHNNRYSNKNKQINNNISGAEISRDKSQSQLQQTKSNDIEEMAVEEFDIDEELAEDDWF